MDRVEGYSRSVVSRRALLKGAVLAAGGVALATAGLIPTNLAAVAASMAGGGNWEKLSPSRSPSKRSYAAMAPDMKTGSIVLFSGLGADPDTWLYDGKNWNQVAANGPPARSGSATAYDPGSNAVLLFSGLGGGQFLEDTWSWDGTRWTAVPSSHTPAPRAGAAIAVDPVSGKLLLFGGYNDRGYLDDTWTWTGSDWALATSRSNPPDSFGGSLGIDPAGLLVLIGGSNSAMGVPTPTGSWHWTGHEWVSSSGQSLSRATFAATALVPTSQSFMRVGGLQDGSVSDEALLWSHGSPKTIGAVRPTARAYAAMAYEPRSGGFLLFGGQDEAGLLGDSWLWTP